MKSYKLVIPVICLAMLASCGRTSNESDQSAPAMVEMKMSGAGDAPNTSFTPPEVDNANSDAVIATDKTSGETEAVKKIIKDGDISIECKDIEVSKKAVDLLLKKHQSYYLSENLSNNENEIYYELSVRIPAQQFETFLSEAENGIGEITWKSIHARDVTEEFYDIQTRLKNKKEYLNRYRELLTKANTVKDIISIEEGIRTLQEEIESAEGRLKYLNDQVAYSTLNLRLSHKKEYVYKPKPRDSFGERVKESLSDSWERVIDFVLMLVSLWPFALVAGIVIFVVIRKRKKV